MAKNRKTPDMNLPMWFDGQNINEALFCEEFLQERRIIFANGAFFTPDGRVTDDLPLRGKIYEKLKCCAVNNIPRKITNILEVLKLEAQEPDFPPEQDRIHVANNFKFSESDRIRENREAVKRDNNNIFDFMESEGYIRLKADASISSKLFYAIYRMWCEENSLAPLKSRSFSDAMIANARKYNLEHCNNITNSAGRRVWGFMGVEAIARPHINGFYGDSPCTYVPDDIPEEWRRVE